VKFVDPDHVEQCTLDYGTTLRVLFAEKRKNIITFIMDVVVAKKCLRSYFTFRFAENTKYTHQFQFRDGKEK